jgi:RHS repeat-associated protein
MLRLWEMFAEGKEPDTRNGKGMRRITRVCHYCDDADKLDEIKVGGSTVKSFGYDAAGRTTSVVTGAGTTTLAYDYESRITTITYPNTSTNTFTYNGLDTRVGKVDSGGTKTYKRDGVGVTAPVLSDGAASYTPGLSERRSGTSTFSHAGIKNQHEQTAANESSAATQTYDAFGNLVSSSGTWKGPFGYGGSFGYQADGDSGLKLLGHRYYDSSTGRFLTGDPAKHGRNWFTYCDANPLKRCDDNGADWIDFFAGWGDMLSGGGVWQLVTGEPFSKSARRLVGDTIGIGDANKSVDEDSSGYAVGKFVGTLHLTAIVMLAPGAAGFRGKVGIHGPHHKFGSVGKLWHFQINIWQDGVKDSGKVLRLPLLVVDKIIKWWRDK